MADAAKGAAKIDAAVPETRHERRRRRHRDAILTAAEELIREKGPDAATMQEISDSSDLALATIYSYFESKDQIVLAVVEGTMNRLGSRIRVVTNTFKDPGQIFAFGVRSLMEAASRDKNWRFLFKRPGLMAETMVKVFGKYGKTDIRQAVVADRYKVEDVALAWRQAMWAVAAVCIAVNEAPLSDDDMAKMFDEAMVNILGLVGVGRDEAWDIARRPRPRLPPE